MKQMRFASLAALGALGFLASGQARSQFSYQRPQTMPNPRPAVSPYLNLLRAGDPAVNYNTLVRPQIEQPRAIQQLQIEVQREQAVLGQRFAVPAGINPSAVLPFTGHPTQFMNLSHYYATTASRQGGSAVGGGR
jgi:hypothetical protein